MQIKYFTPFVCMLTFWLSFSACRSNKVVYKPAPGKSVGKTLPPGQAKKISGHQSARAFAPGQQKKKVQPKHTASKGNKGAKGKK